MTIKSYLWEGTVTGDASYAPYSKDEFNHYVNSTITANDGSSVWVVPLYKEDLAAEASAPVYGLQIKPGCAIIKNYLYIQEDNVNLTFTRPGYNKCRNDLVILRLDWSTQTVRLDVLEGEERDTTGGLANIFIPPGYAQSENYIWEIPLYAVTVFYSDGYLLDRNIRDLREFVVTNHSRDMYDGSYNLIKNSEYMAFSDGGITHWDVIGTIESGDLTIGTKFSEQPRGRVLDMNGGVATLSQTMQCAGGEDTFTIKFLVSTDAGAPAANHWLSIYGVDSAGNVDSDSEVSYAHYPIDTDFPSEPMVVKKTFKLYKKFSRLYIVINCKGYIGQHILVPGYHPGDFRAFHEVLMFDSEKLSSVYAAGGVSSGTYTLNFNTDFQLAAGTERDMVLPGTRHVILNVLHGDSGSAAAGAAYLLIQNAAPYTTVYGYINVSGKTNNTHDMYQIIASIESGIRVSPETRTLRLVVSASGVNTGIPYVILSGIIT